jgi:endonuclease/exonuclease/phosphatase (EEP) superfamily protein YafD
MPVRRPLLVLIAVAAPWGWFAVRDRLAVFEVVAIAMPLIGAVAGLAAIVTARVGIPGRRAGVVLFLLSIGAVAATATVLPRTPVTTGRPGSERLYLVSANLAADNPDAGEVIRGLASGFPDVIVTVETNEEAILALADLEDEYPFVELGPEGVRSRVVVYSKYPLTALPPLPDVDFAQVLPVEVAAESGTFTLFASHLPRPWLTGSNGTAYQATLAEQQAIVAGFAGAVAATEGPVVVAGDLNLTDRGRGYRTLLDVAGLTDVVRDEWAGSTSLRWWALVLRIDHVLAGGGMCGASPARLTLPGSDHRGLWVELGPCADPAAAG